jgi:hypothetical protein
LFATLAGSFISVADKELRGIVGGGRWTVVSEEKSVETLEGLQV